ncbi:MULTISPECIES: histidine phosphatase family protein [unclassified Pseudomonas]|uniref:lipopolysaccharide core heptose(II)-phosphate phosphatase PmrG n=1 Tax=unclassified Pseudomonas TaxID=196821 RepID=UPI002AC97A3E|nr:MULTISPECIES: histidine phosphatase family protein [unclassified Pseudomonas]MEB0039914.1 histidine phosphatase family protein [Pseudomonas sp. MH10]MEB0077145.1 histidine phosphatase family protein [Pseudomonas sp. MH10out]MEB0093056.1 histidine phosphatase family protein [Pseudomonas sp. CCI4.2]MEB0102260.1 histidine phosphatase family protein [Pseudomonas sp. CCI3.2]MEB0123524.1 histidine phosphatase family protein [Pseudomonas sp. CCI1.2]
MKTSTDVSTPSLKTPNANTLKKAVFATVLVLCIVLVMGFVWWPKSLTDLGKHENMITAGVYSHWQQGDIVALVRHAERCDRSSNPCLGPADGITQAGSDTAVLVGKAFNRLGMSNTDVMSSPLHRTAQTSFAMFGKASPNQEWLVNCEHAMLDNVLTHKTAHRNMVLVTHSGCMSALEKELGFPHAKTSEYASTFLVSIGADGRPKVLGFINYQDWASTLDKKP